ncbi:MAG: hypothetical protein COV57_00430 [Candidatus Liptonbacteria bacterium CG11_big_fil_rev_8_21_14_0_20_35_14]|uniref:Response regulatory domain-containing protein n=1 Tax=Candidatus Liptonbacteria bacterium CG11_big_fil_rev_8_21_14_0_20_35_14 TaxID=1974634 RepID=A0A2H0N8H6_9BACT|nr:MAG: hypothetical protein COV57_00430 [Candidatus Liptonbacteria bacterium CG11_big_fil_rev_8_21_14_0_20_35_14]
MYITNMLNQAPQIPQQPATQEPLSIPLTPAIPVKQPVIAEENNQTVQASQVQPQINFGQAVLLVEDDPFLSSLMKTKLEQSGLSVILATDGEQAIELAEKYIPRVVLLDLILPKKSGFEVLEAIRNNPQIGNIPIVILSNLGQDSDVSKGKDLGAIEYFIKAKTSIDDLVGKVQGFLQGQKLS